MAARRSPAHAPLAAGLAPHRHRQAGRAARTLAAAERGGMALGQLDLPQPEPTEAPSGLRSPRRRGHVPGAPSEIQISRQSHARLHLTPPSESRAPVSRSTHPCAAACPPAWTGSFTARICLQVCGGWLGRLPGQRPPCEEPTCPGSQVMRATRLAFASPRPPTHTRVASFRRPAWHRCPSRPAGAAHAHPLPEHADEGHAAPPRHGRRLRCEWRSGDDDR